MNGSSCSIVCSHIFRPVEHRYLFGYIRIHEALSVERSSLYIKKHTIIIDVIAIQILNIQVKYAKTGWR